MTTDKNLVLYYKARAAEYEKIYSKPERQEDLIRAFSILQKRFLNQSVCEIACGTGFWTEKISETSKSIHATDINDTVIEIAKTKQYKCPVTFEVVDLYRLNSNTKYDSAFGGFIWSHILLQDLDSFIDQVKKLVLPGGTVAFMDNRYVEGSNHPITKSDELGNTYQTRNLERGTAHEVLKNFPDADFLRETLSRKGIDDKITSLTYFWIGSFKLA